MCVRAGPRGWVLPFPEVILVAPYYGSVLGCHPRPQPLVGRAKLGGLPKPEVLSGLTLGRPVCVDDFLRLLVLYRCTLYDCRAHKMVESAIGKLSLFILVLMLLCSMYHSYEYAYGKVFFFNCTCSYLKTLLASSAYA